MFFNVPQLLLWVERTFHSFEKRQKQSRFHRPLSKLLVLANIFGKSTNKGCQIRVVVATVSVGSNSYISSSEGAMSSGRRSRRSSSSTGSGDSFDATSRTMQLLMQQQKAAPETVQQRPRQRKSSARSRRRSTATSSGGSDGSSPRSKHDHPIYSKIESFCPRP